MKNNLYVITVAHVLACVTGFLILYTINPDYILPDNINLLKQDAIWYNRIVQEGYKYIPGGTSTLAFFPLFPLFWKYTMLTPVLISIVNLIIFLYAFNFLMATEEQHYSMTLLFISFPSFIFFALPYSESFFFLFCTFIVVGLKTKNPVLIYIGLFGSSVTRSVCVFFIPAILICDMFYILKNKGNTREKYKALGLKIIFSLAGFFLVVLYQWWVTETLFEFIKVQKFWGRGWLLPSFPLTTISAERVLAFDGLAFLLGLIAIYLVVKWCTIIAFRLNKTTNVEPQVLFSGLYICATTLLDVFFTYNLGGATNIWSLNRHLLATPFMIVFVLYIIKEDNLNKVDWIVILLLTTLSLYLTGVFQFKFAYMIYGFYILTIYALKSHQEYRKVYLLVHIIPVLLQIKFFEEFLQGRWLG